MGTPSRKRCEKSSRSMIRATVVRPVSRSTSAMSIAGEPVGVVHQLDAVGIEVEHRPHLLDVGAGVGLDLVGGQRRAGGRAAGGIADPGGEVADDQHREVSEILELAQFVQNDRMAEMDVGRGRVDAELHPQRPARSQLGPELVGVDAVDRARRQDLELLVHVARRCPAHGPAGRAARAPLGGRGRRKVRRCASLTPGRYQRARIGPRPFATMTPMSRRARLLIAFVLVALVATSCRYTTHLRLPDEQAVSSRILWSDGSLLTRVHGVEDRDPVTLGAMAKVLPRAVIAIEDERYYEHGGFDVRGILRALTHNIEKGRLAEGGSTITQQYVRSVMLGNQKSFKRKLREAVMAMQLEERYSKKTILERYLNTVYFGNGAYGVQAAARTYFGKDAKDVDLVQSALLAGLIRAPNDYDPYVHPDAAIARRNEVLAKMHDLHEIGDAEETLAEGAARSAWSRSTTNDRYPAPFFVQKVKKFIFNDPHFGATVADRERKLFEGGLTIETTLDQQVAAGGRHRAARDPHRPDRSARRARRHRPPRRAREGVHVEPGLLRHRSRRRGSPRSASSTSPTPANAGRRPASAAPAARSSRSCSRPRSSRASRSPAPTTGNAPDDDPDPGLGRRGRCTTSTTRTTAASTSSRPPSNSVNTVYGQLVMDVGPQNVADAAKAMGIPGPLRRDRRSRSATTRRRSRTWPARTACSRPTASAIPRCS